MTAMTATVTATTMMTSRQGVARSTATGLPEPAPKALSLRQAERAGRRPLRRRGRRRARNGAVSSPASRPARGPAGSRATCETGRRGPGRGLRSAPAAGRSVSETRQAVSLAEARQNHLLERRRRRRATRLLAAASPRPPRVGRTTVAMGRWNRPLVRERLAGWEAGNRLLSGADTPPADRLTLVASQWLKLVAALSHRGPSQTSRPSALSLLLSPHPHPPRRRSELARPLLGASSRSREAPTRFCRRL